MVVLLLTCNPMPIIYRYENKFLDDFLLKMVDPRKTPECLAYLQYIICYTAEFAVSQIFYSPGYCLVFLRQRS